MKIKEQTNTTKAIYNKLKGDMSCTKPPQVCDTKELLTQTTPKSCQPENEFKREQSSS